MTLVGGCLLALVLLAGCGGGSSKPTPKPAATKKGGTFRMNVSETDVAYLDPALDYESVGGQFLTATCARLENYRDVSGKAGTVLYPEVAAAPPRVSSDGKTYTYSIRKGFRFNTGAPVTAKSFERALIRGAHPKMPSPAIGFMDDIVGAEAFHTGKARSISGVKAVGDKLTIRLTAPSGTLENRLAFTFFCAVPENLPISPRGVKLPPMAGPYYFAQRVPGHLIVLKRNPYYGGMRPRHVDEIRATMRTNRDTSLLQVKKGEADYDSAGVPPASHGELGKQFGVNRDRYRVNPQQAIDYIALNTRRGPFKDVKLRQAANYAINRVSLAQLVGKYGGQPTDQILPPTVPGFRDAKIYPLDGPDLARAKQLAGGTKATVTLLYPISPVGDSYAQVIQQNLKAIGLTVKLLPRSFDAFVTLSGKPTTAYDMALGSWLADFPDPWDFINILFGEIRPDGNQNLAQLDVPALRAKMAAASRLHGQARYEAYAKLDEEITRDYAPWVATDNPNVREFVAARVGCYSAPGSSPYLDLATVCLK